MNARRSGMVLLFVGVGGITVACILLGRWTTSRVSHLGWELAAVLAAWMAASAALARVLSSGDRFLLFLGLSFFTTGLLDAGHLLMAGIQSDLPSLLYSVRTTGIWLASRLCLGLFLLSSLFTLKYSFPPDRSQSWKFTGWLITGVVFLGLVLPLMAWLVPRWLPEGHLLRQPWELLPGVVFGGALIAYGVAHRQQPHSLFKWTILVLALNVLAQVIMALSGEHERGMGNLAHGLRLSSYLAFALPLWVENWERFRLLEQRRLEVSAVVQLTGALARSLDVQEVLQRVYTQAQTLFAAEGIRVETFGENQVNGRVSAVYGWGEEDWQSTLNRSDVVFTEINLWEPQAPRVITDVQQNPPLAVVLAPLGVRGVVSLPLVENGEISGVFFLLWRKPIEPWSSSHLRLAKALADEAMVALQRARLYEEEERRRRQLQALLEISALLSSTHDLERLIQTVLAQAVQLITPVDSGALLLYDEETDKLNVRAVYGVAATSLQGRKFSLQEGLFGRVFRTGKPQVTWEGKPLQVEVLPRTPAQPFPHHRLSPPEVLSDLLCVPLVAQEKPIGVVVLRATPGSAPFTQEDVSLLQAFANQAAVAIENARLYRAIHQLAITDPLTGLFNRRHFESRLGIELARADRAQQPVSLVLLDIDHFKPFNDRFGHLCGDRLLKRLAHFVQGAVRRIDVVARIGGEEFAIILPLTGKQGALIVADNLRRGVAALEFEGDGDQPVVHKTISLGVATYPDDAEAAEALLQRADEALYRAKREGRNRVCGAEEGQ